MAPLAPRNPDGRLGRRDPGRRGRGQRHAAFGGRLPETAGPLTLAQTINAHAHRRAGGAARDAGLRRGCRPQGRRVRRHPRAAVSRFGAGRVFDTLLDEQSILGLALGAGLAGLLPVPEIQYLAYLHNAADQIRGEARHPAVLLHRASTATRWWCGSPATPTRRASAGTSTTTTRSAVLRDIPGLVIASPARPDDAAAMLRTCLAAAASGRQRLRLPRADRALPHPRPAQDEDGGVAGPLRPPRAGRRARSDRPGPHPRRRHRPDDRDVRQRAAAEPAGGARLLAGGHRRPRAGPALAGAAAGRGHPARGDATGRVLVVDETRRTGRVAEGVLTALADDGFTRRVARVTSEDSFIPLGDAADAVLLSQQDIEIAARELMH